jgi:CheY-like chemotaxis protein
MNCDLSVYPQSQPLTGLQLLVIDDELDNLDLLAFVLQDAGARVTAVTSAQTALGVLERLQPDVILCDLMLPDVDGCVLIQQLRAREAKLVGSPTPAVVVTAMAREQDRQHALEAGFQAYILKPFDLEQVIETVASVASGRLEPPWVPPTFPLPRIEIWNDRQRSTSRTEFIGD